ncbi:MAG: hypothetical protein F4Y02_06035 [Chloroflexi bacterium]|nr:hypothetical protein [Chloroflexota bacterium]
MYPLYVVWLEDNAGCIVQHELFFSQRKARRAYRRAARPNDSGLHELYGEDDSYTATADVTAVIRLVGTNLSTKKDKWRKSFLNLTEDEEQELSKRLRIPVRIVQQISRMEKDIVEKKRYYMHPQDERTSALIRKYAPEPLAKIFRKII